MEFEALEMNENPIPNIEMKPKSFEAESWVIGYIGILE